MKTNTFHDMLYAVSALNKNYEKHGKKVESVWAESMHKNFRAGRYDLAYEYVALQELLLVVSMRKTDHFRLKVWRMFVGDFRRAFSDHEFEIFQQLKKSNII